MADAAQVQIVNDALFLLGQEPVADLSEPSLEGSNAATKLMRAIERARDTVLRRHGFVCALKYVTLTPAILSGDVNFRYPTAYQPDTDCLRVWEIEGVSALGCVGDPWAPRWQVGSFETDSGARQIIRAQNATASLNVVYIRRAAWAALDPHVGDAVAHDLAARGCYSITGDMAKAQKLAQTAEAKAMMAISVDGTQEGGQPSLAPSIPQAIRNYSR